MTMPIYPIFCICTSQHSSRSLLVAHPPDPRRSACIPPRLSPGLGRRCRVRCIVWGMPQPSPQPSSPALATTNRLAQYESPGRPCSALLIFSPSRLTGSDSGQSGSEQRASGLKERWRNGECMPNTLLGAPLTASGPVLVCCAADRELLAQSVFPKAVELESTNISVNISSARASADCAVQVQVPKSPVARWTGGCCTTNHGRR